MKRILLAVALCLIASQAFAQRCSDGQCSQFNQQTATQQQQQLPQQQPALNFQLPKSVPIDETPKAEPKAKKTSDDVTDDDLDGVLVKRRARAITLDVAAVRQITRAPVGDRYDLVRVASKTKAPRSVFSKR